MANGDVQLTLAADASAAYDRPLVVPVISKLTKFPFLQELAFNGQLGFLAKSFVGLADFFDNMTTYSSTHPILLAAWATIQERVPLNLDLQDQLYISEALGQVGLAFQEIPNFDQVFAVDPSDLESQTAAGGIGGQIPTAPSF